MNSTQEYALIALLVLAGYLLQHYWTKWHPQNEKEDVGRTTYDSDIDKLLNNEEFKVKGRFEN